MFDGIGTESNWKLVRKKGGENEERSPKQKRGEEPKMRKYP